MTIVLWLAAIYGAVGLAFAAIFVAVGIGRVDPVAHDAPLGFRLIVLPGCAALWPLVLGRWVRAR
jgi:hypothetical protein